MATISENGEQLFERFCAALKLTPTRIAEAADDGEQRPDYRVIGSDGNEFIAEVKLVTPSDEEARDIARVYAGEVFATSGTPGDRMRRLISKANRQLKALGGEQPGVLVVFNPEFLLKRHTDPYAILTAMRGLDTIDVQVPRDPREEPIFGALRSGRGKKMTETNNTSTGAVICPWETAEGMWGAGIYHNRFAACRLSSTAIQGDHITHFRIADDEREWTHLEAAV